MDWFRGGPASIPFENCSALLNWDAPSVRRAILNQPARALVRRLSLRGWRRCGRRRCEVPQEAPESAA